MSSARGKLRQQSEAPLKSSHDEGASISVETITPGDATNFPSLGDTVGVHYIGRLLPSEEEFDNSYRRGQLLYFILGAKQVISGWEETIPRMSQGQKVLLRLPSKYAYGEEGFPPSTFHCLSCLNTFLILLILIKSFIILHVL